MQCGRTGFDPWVGKVPWRRERLPTPVLWPGEFHGVPKSWTKLSNFHFQFYMPATNSPKLVTAMLLGQEVVGGEGAGKEQEVQTNR